jgi:hypothetical protein
MHFRLANSRSPLRGCRRDTDTFAPRKVFPSAQYLVVGSMLGGADFSLFNGSVMLPAYGPALTVRIRSNLLAPLAYQQLTYSAVTSAQPPTITQYQ